MNELIITKGRIRQACDACFTLRKKCDLELPTCSMCKARGIKCTRLRKSKRKPRMYEDKKFHEQTFQLALDKKGNNAKIGRFFNGTIAKQLNNMMNSKDVRVNTLGSSISIFPLKLFFTPVLMDAVQYSLYIRDNNLGIKMLFNQTKLECLEAIKINQSSINLNDFNNTLHKSIEVYFSRVNPLLPLFTKRQFYGKPRSLKLFYSVALVGLSLLSNEEGADEIAKHLGNYLTDSFKPSKACETLGDIQSMIVLINGLRGHRYGLPSYYFTNLKGCCTLMGLHLVPNNKVDFDTIIERKLCFSAFLFLNSIDEVDYLRNFEPLHLWKNHRDNLDQLIYSKDEDDIIKYSYLIMAKIYYYSGIVLQRLFEIILHNFDLKISNAKAINLIHWANKLLLESYKGALFKLERIQTTLSQNAKQEISKITSTINIIYYSIILSTFDMEELASCSSPEEVFTSHELNEHILDDKILDTYYNTIIENNYKLGLECVSSFRYYSFFILQRSLYSPCNIKKYQWALNIINSQLFSICQNSMSDKTSEVINKMILSSNSDK